VTMSIPSDLLRWPASNGHGMRVMACARVGLLLLLIGAHSAACDEPSDLKKELLFTYGDAAVRPTGHDGPPVNVTTQIFIERMHNVDERMQTWGFEGYLRLWWHDPRLRYNTSSVRKLVLKRQEMLQIWKPDVYWESQVKVELPSGNELVDSGAGRLLEFYPDGVVFSSSQISMVLACRLHLRDMPFDTQGCTYMMGMYGSTSAEVRLMWRPESVALDAWNTSCIKNFIATRLEQDNPTIDRTRWPIAVEELSTRTVDKPRTLCCESTPRVEPAASFASRIADMQFSYTYARAKISFTRRADALLFGYLIPGVLMVFMSMLGFLIDPSIVPARVTLGVITILVVFGNFTALSALLPPGQEPVWLQRLLIASAFFNVIAFVEQVRHPSTRVPSCPHSRTALTACARPVSSRWRSATESRRSNGWISRRRVLRPTVLGATRSRCIAARFWTCSPSGTWTGMVPSPRKSSGRV
jgi:hypothetical protein